MTNLYKVQILLEDYPEITNAHTFVVANTMAEAQATVCPNVSWKSRARVGVVDVVDHPEDFEKYQRYCDVWQQKPF